MYYFTILVRKRKNFSRTSKGDIIMVSKNDHADLKNDNELLPFEGSEDLLDLQDYADNENEITQLNLRNKIEAIEEEKRIIMGASKAILKNKINITREFLSVFDLKRKFERFEKYKEKYQKENTYLNLSDMEDSLVLEPDFQRSYVWPRKKKIQLIESILLGIPLPSFYFSEDINSNLLVVDGKQRLNAIIGFINNNSSMYLEKQFSFLTQDKEEMNKIFFRDLEDNIQRRIEDFSLMCYIIGAGTAPLLQNEIFVRVNRGGVPLNSQEIRNAVNVGKVTLNLLDRISLLEDYLSVVNTKRKRDQYVAIRFFSFNLQLFDLNFQQLYNLHTDYNNIDDYLDFVMKYINTMSDREIDKLYYLYVTTLEKCKLFFSLTDISEFSRKGHQTFNMNVFEVWMNVLSQFSITEIEKNFRVFQTEYEKNIHEDKNFEDNILSRRDFKEKYIDRHATILKMIDNLLSNF